MKRTFALGVGCLVLGGLFSGAYGDKPSTAPKPATTPEEAHHPSFWMKKKLEYSQQILDGLSNEDFAKVLKNAEAMNGLSQIEKWVHANRRGYRSQLAVFHDANERLIKQAENENLDGAALAFVQLTMSCVNCHKIVRDATQSPPQ